MKWLMGLLAGVAILALIPFGLPLMKMRDSQVTANAWKIVDEGSIEVWNNYSGQIQSRQVQNIMSRMNGVATLVDIVADGTAVEPGQVIARFDAVDLEQEVIRLKREHRLASIELDSLEQAQIPLELAELEGQNAELVGRLDYEKIYLRDSQSLLEESLLSEQEVQKQRNTVRQIQAELTNLTSRISLTRGHLHPLAVEKAEAKVSAAKQALALATLELENSIIRAPASGVVAYRALHVSGEYRTVRIGDQIYPNQPFLMIPDLEDLEVSFFVPESELSAVRLDLPTLTRPLAYPELGIESRVASVASVAQNLPDKPRWQRYFQARSPLDNSDGDIRPGMSVTIHVRAQRKSHIARVPRASVFWQGDNAYVKRVEGQEAIPVAIVLGVANDHYYEVVSGVAIGERIETQ